MNYLYGVFSDEQISQNAKYMHRDIHKLLMYKDKEIVQKVFESDDDFKLYFFNLLTRFGGLNDLLGAPYEMVMLMSTLQVAFKEVQKESFDYKFFRKLILDAHGYLTSMFGEVR